MSVDDLFKSAPEVRPTAITGKEHPADLLATAFPAFVGRQIRDAYRLMRHSALGDHTVFLTMSGAMTPAGLHRSCIIPMIQRGLVDVLTTTGANLYHDAHRIIGHQVREIAPDGGDVAYREARIIRIYDLGFPEDALLDTDHLFSWFLQADEVQKPMTTAELHAYLGRRMLELETALGVDQPSLLSTCYTHGVPVFVGAPQDASIFLNIVKLKALLGSKYKLSLDITADVFQMAAVQWLAQNETETAVWILGGGVPKNYTLQGEPTLSQIFGLDARGFDVDVQLCVEVADNGALSSCPAGEGHTWGKVSADCVEHSSVYARADVTAVLPFIVHALFAEGITRPHKRMLDRLAEANAKMVKDLEPLRDQLMADIGRKPASVP